VYDITGDDEDVHFTRLVVLLDLRMIYRRREREREGLFVFMKSLFF